MFALVHKLGLCRTTHQKNQINPNKDCAQCNIDHIFHLEYL